MIIIKKDMHSFLKSIAMLLMFLLGVNTLQAQFKIGRITKDFKVKSFKKGDIENIKNGKTIFVLPLEHDVEEYKTILKEAWTLNDFKVVSIRNYDPLDYLDQNCLIATVKVRFVSTNGQPSHFSPEIRFTSYDWDRFNKVYNSLSIKAKENRKESLLTRFSTEFGIIYLSTKVEVWNSFLRREGVLPTLLKKDSYYNLGLGVLFNTFQTVNDQFEKGEIIDIDKEKIRSSKLAELKNQTLYMSNLIFDKFKIPFPVGFPSLEKMDDLKISEIMKSYKNEYKLLSDEELNRKILSQEKFYYIKFDRLYGLRVFQVIDSLSGEIVFFEFEVGVNLTQKLIKKLNKAIHK